MTTPPAPAAARTTLTFRRRPPTSRRAPRRRQRGGLRRAGASALALLLLLVAGVCVGEWLGWPFLAQPLQTKLGNVLHRQVSFAAAAVAGDADARRLRIHFFGHLRIDAPFIEIGVPDWSRAPHMLVARDAALTLAYADLYRAWRGEPLRIRGLRARQADIQVERLADGRASWQFGAPPPPGTPPSALPLFDRLQVDSGNLHYVDAPLKADVLAEFALVDGRSAVRPAAAASTAAAAASSANRLKVNAKGRWRGFPVKIDLQSIGVLPWVADDAAAPALPLELDANIGGARLTFRGTVTDALHLRAMRGRFSLSGPSLAAVGDPLGITLPTTSAFRTEGLLARQGSAWRAVFNSATIGSSSLNGAFSYDTGGALPLLSGRLGGSKLLLADLGPAVGTRGKPAAAAASASANAAAAAAAASAASASAAAGKRRNGRVLPDRAFDLPALRAMNANVLVDVADVDLGSSFLEPLQPLRAHLVLQDGVLSLKDIEARTAQGRLAGLVQLDGRASSALWNVDLNWNDVRLERFFHQARAAGQPPFVSGRMRGETKLEGQGRSTAEILGSLRGNLRTQLRDGAVSHFAVEAAGIDIAQALGMLVKGDDALPVTCAVADLAVTGGKMVPRVLVIDTDDSAIWIDGSLSLATEALDLRAVVTPKDFSPLTLRTPLRVRGSFAQPELSLEKGPLARTIGASALLALVNPLAALIPLVDIGQPTAAEQGAAGCKSLVRRGQASRAVAPGRAMK